MDILILNWKDIKNPGKGGAEVIAFELAKRLAADGHNITFFSRSFPNCPSEEMIDDVKVVRKGGIFSVYFFAYIYYKNLDKKPDKVIDMINTICWQTPLYVPREKRIAYLNQLAHQVWFYEFPFLIACIGIIFERLEYQTYKHTRILCYSESTKKDLIAIGITKENIATFSTGIDVDKYVPAQKSKTPLFVFIARLVKMKRADVCIQAMNLVIKKYPSAKLAIIGNGPDQKRLEKLRNQLLLQNEVVFIDKNNFYIKQTDKDLKVKYMQQAWVLLLPSVKEGWGMVVTEAGACGTPAIVSGVSGLTDSVINKKTGIVLSSYPRVNELAQTMITLISDHALRKRLSKKAYEFNNQFSWERSYEQFKELITS